MSNPFGSFKQQLRRLLCLCLVYQPNSSVDCSITEDFEWDSCHPKNLSIYNMFLAASAKTSISKTVDETKEIVKQRTINITQLFTDFADHCPAFQKVGVDHVKAHGLLQFLQCARELVVDVIENDFHILYHAPVNMKPELDIPVDEDWVSEAKHLGTLLFDLTGDDTEMSIPEVPDNVPPRESYFRFLAKDILYVKFESEYPTMTLLPLVQYDTHLLKRKFDDNLEPFAIDDGRFNHRPAANPEGQKIWTEILVNKDGKYDSCSEFFNKWDSFISQYAVLYTMMTTVFSERIPDAKISINEEEDGENDEDIERGSVLLSNMLETICSSTDLGNRSLFSVSSKLTDDGFFHELRFDRFLENLEELCSNWKSETTLPTAFKEEFTKLYNKEKPPSWKEELSFWFGNAICIKIAKGPRYQYFNPKDDDEFNKCTEHANIATMIGGFYSGNPQVMFLNVNMNIQLSLKQWSIDIEDTKIDLLV